jgi:hypothetical protein
VDFPDPLGPITATISPAATLTDAPRSAGVGPKDFSTPRASIKAGWASATVLMI